MSTTDLATKYKLNRVTIQRYLIKGGVSLRRITPKTKVNHYYFSKYSKENCYWAGFILADGYIRTNKRFTLSIKLQKGDIDHLEKLKNDIKFEGKIIERPLYVNIDISSTQIVKDLQENFGIHTKKSLTCEISSKIPQKYLKDFIRGYFDGDGCITYTTVDTISFVGTEKTVNFIKNFIYETARIKLRSKNLPDTVVNGNICCIYYSGKTAYSCLKYLYENSTTYLSRKFKLYQELINKYQ